MKKYFTVVLMLILTMALIPASVNTSMFQNIFSQKKEQEGSRSIISTNKSSGYDMPQNLTFTDKSTGKNSSRSAKSLIYSLVGAAVSENFTESEVKALAIALHTQLCHENEQQKLTFDTANRDIFLNENELKKKFGNNYTTLCSYCDNVYDSLILSSGKPANLNIDYLTDTPDNNADFIIKADPYSLLSSDYSTEVSFDKDTFFAALRKLNPDINTDISPQNSVGKITYFESGEVDTVSISGTDFSGNEIANAFSLPYSRFTLVYSLDKFTFTVNRPDASNSLNRNTARLMALQGNTCYEILNYLYSL